MEEGSERLRGEEDDANVIYGLERSYMFKSSHNALFIDNFNDARRVRRVKQQKIKSFDVSSLSTLAPHT